MESRIQQDFAIFNQQQRSDIELFVINIFQFSVEEIEILFSELINSTIKSLVIIDHDTYDYDDSYFNDDNLAFPIYEFPLMQWAAFCFQFARLKDSAITSLTLSWNSFAHLPAVCKQEFFCAVRRSGIRNLSIKGNTIIDSNGPGRYYPEQYTTFFNTLRYSGIIILDLSHAFDGLIDDGDDPYPVILMAISLLKDRGLISLDLSHTLINGCNENEWTAFYAELKDSSITCLKLNNNDLRFYGEQWPAFRKGLSSTRISELQLSAENQYGPESVNDIHMMESKEIIQNNICKHGLDPRKGLQNICAFTFWKSPAANVETVKNHDGSKKHLCHNGISEPVEICEDHFNLLIKAENSRRFGVY